MEFNTIKNIENLKNNSEAWNLILSNYGLLDTSTLRDIKNSLISNFGHTNGYYHSGSSLKYLIKIFGSPTIAKKQSRKILGKRINDLRELAGALDIHYFTIELNELDDELEIVRIFIRNELFKKRKKEQELIKKDYIDYYGS